MFGSFAEDGPSLTEHLGAAAGELDRLARLSPEGEIELTAGWLQAPDRANWKMLAENETDGYHPQFVHGSIFGVAGSPIGALYSDKSTAVTPGSGRRPQRERPAARVPPVRPADALVRHDARIGCRSTSAAMRQSYGADAEQIMVEGGPHVMIFPNLFVAEIQVFNIQPVAVERVRPVRRPRCSSRAAPELNRRMLPQSIGSVGPAGMLLADDTEMYERNQRGLAARSPEWLDVSRGCTGSGRRGRAPGRDGHRRGRRCAGSGLTTGP